LAIIESGNPTAIKWKKKAAAETQRVEMRNEKEEHKSGADYNRGPLSTTNGKEGVLYSRKVQLLVLFFRDPQITVFTPKSSRVSE